MRETKFSNIIFFIGLFVLAVASFLAGADDDPESVVSTEECGLACQQSKITKTPTIRSLDPTDSRNDGIYIVGKSIAPGLWRSRGVQSDCYWARYNSQNDLLDNHFGVAGGTVNIRSSDLQVEFRDCGSWKYVEDEIVQLRANGKEPKDDGFYTVGLEISPGNWFSQDGYDSCYWARMDSYQNIIDNHYGQSGGLIVIRPTDYEVEFSGCGTFEFYD